MEQVCQNCKHFRNVLDDYGGGWYCTRCPIAVEDPKGIARTFTRYSTCESIRGTNMCGFEPANFFKRIIGI